MPIPMVKLSGISKYFGKTRVLDNINLTVHTGEFLTLVGMSGCGKSTLLRIISGLESPDNGQILLNGQDVSKQDSSERNLAMVFQSYALYPHMTVRQNIATPLRLKKLSLRERLPLLSLIGRSKEPILQEINAHVEKSAHILRISELLERRPAELSGGQRQRVALARAMVREPLAFLMDEPLSNLDASLRSHMRVELASLQRRLATTFIYVTHDQIEAMVMSDRMALMEKGRIIQTGTPQELYKYPNSITAAKFIGTHQINIIPVDITSTGNILLMGKNTGLSTSVHTYKHALLGIRPEDVIFSPSGLSAKIIEDEFHGADHYLTFELLNIENCLLKMRLNTSDPLEVNADGITHLSFRMPSTHLFNTEGIRIDHNCNTIVAA